MARIGKGFNVDVALKDVGGQELVVCSLTNVGQWQLTSDEARIVAIKLIAVVNRAEVRRNLKHNCKLSREAAVADPATRIME